MNNKAYVEVSEFRTISSLFSFLKCLCCLRALRNHTHFSVWQKWSWHMGRERIWTGAKITFQLWCMCLKLCAVPYHVEWQNAAHWWKPAVGWPWLDQRCPPEPLYQVPSSAGLGKENIRRGLWVKIRARKNHSPIISWGKQTQLGEFAYLLPIKSE